MHTYICRQVRTHAHTRTDNHVYRLTQFQAQTKSWEDSHPHTGTQGNGYKHIQTQAYIRVRRYTETVYDRQVSGSRRPLNS